MKDLGEDLKSSVDSLKQAAESVTRPYQAPAADKPSDTDGNKN
jgi:hypothetical protein